jgi:WD40 repeat protein
MSRLAGRLSRLMVGLYPRRWRRRYREELLAVLDEHQSTPRTVASLALGALGTHLDPAYRREGITMPGPGSSLRTAAQVTAIAGVLVAVVGGLLALNIRHEQQTDGALTASYAAGVAVSPNTRLGVTAQGTGPGDSCCDLVWRIGAHPKLLAHFPGGAPLAFAPDGQTVAAASPAGVTEWSLASPAKPVRIATMPGPNTAVGIASAPRRTLVAIAYPRAVQLWNLANPAAPHRIATIAAAANVPTNCGHCSNLDYIAFSPDGRTLATTAAQHAISLWDVSTPWAPRHLATIGRDTGPIAALAFSPAGSQLAYLRQNGELTVFSLTDPAHTVQTVIPGPPAALAHWGNYALSYSPDGTRLTAVVLIEEEGGGRTACSWNTTGLSQPLPADCRSDHFSIPGAFTFTSGRAAIVGPDPRGAGRLSNTLSIWPPLPR